MQKKKFDLTSDIIEVKLEGNNNHKTSKTDTSNNKNVLLTISVNVETRKEFKTWCARNGLKMNEAFIKGFHLLKKQEYT